MSTKRKIEDYKDQKVVIHCSTKEEWDKIVDLLPSNRSVKKNCWQNSVNNGKSDTINIEGYGWSPKKHFENTGYTIYPASDFLEEKPFKFNIGDEIKAKPGGYYFCDPERFKEQHKILLPSSESRISNKITERTQAQGFNWYRCGHGNWITEEGLELVKEDIPEYDKCINTSKSLVGRYLKALVDYPNGSSVLKGEIGIITEEYKGIPSEVHFPSQNYYVINSTTYKNGESYELMPEGFKPEDDLISEAKKRYPLGTKFKPAYVGDTTNYCIVTEDSVFEKYGDQIMLTVNGEYWIDRENPKYGNTNCNRVVYYKGKWAEIVSDGQGINTYGLKVGDILKQEIINAWAGIEGNFYAYVQTGWVGIFSNYIKDRKIEDFRDIDGQVGFHVSECAEGSHYLKAEGFKEFADNFYKKEVKSWIQEQDEMLNVIIKQHPLTPKECYSSNEIIIPQVIKAQKTIQKITIESPTELDLKLKTIKPKQIQTIKI